MAPTPEATANLFLKHVRQLVRLLRYGSREVVLTTVGLLLLVLARWVHALKEEVLLAKVPNWVQPGLSTALGVAGGLCLLLAARQVWRKVAAPPLNLDEPRLPALKGAASFGSQDAELFARLGRSDEVQNLRQRILDDQTPLVVVMGESGVGKTSLLRAGLASSLEHDGISVLYWEALPTSPEAGLLHAVRSSWEKRDEAPESFTALASAISSRSLVMVIDQFEQLSPDQHPAMFALLREVLLANPPYQATWIVAFRREYAATWRDFELSLPDYAAKRLDTLSFQRFLRPAARRVVAVLAEEAGLAIDQTVVGELVDGIAVDGRVSPVDIGITLLGLGEITAEDGGNPLFTLDSFRTGGGQAGLLTRYLEKVLGQLPAEERGELLLALLGLIDLEKDQRIAEGRTLSALEESTRPPSPNRFAAGMRFLASGKARVLENLVAPPSEPRYRLVHERLVAALRSLSGVLLAEAQRAGMLLERDYRVWRPEKKRKYLLAGRDLQVVLRHQGHFHWGDDQPGKRDFLRKSKRKRAVSWALATIGCMTVLALGLGLRVRLGKMELHARFASWHLPENLGEQLDQLEELDLYQVKTLDSLDWLSAAEHLQTLSLAGLAGSNGQQDSLKISSLAGLPPALQSLTIWDANVTSLAGLPPGLKSLTVLDANVTNLAGLPPGLQSLTIGIAREGLAAAMGPPPEFWPLVDASDTKVVSLAGLPPALRSLTVLRANITDLAGLPAGLRSLDISDSKVESLAWLPLGLQSLKIQGTNVTSLAGLPPGLQSLEVSGVNFNSLEGLPPEIHSLVVWGPKITSLTGLPLGLQSLRISYANVASLAGLPPGLKSLTVREPMFTELERLRPEQRSLVASGARLTSLAGLPPGLKSLHFSGANVTSLAGLPPELLSLVVEERPTQNKLTSLVGLPPGLRSLKIQGANITSLAGLPPGLQSLVWEDSITSLAGLPPGLRSLEVSEVNINSLEGLPPEIRSLVLYGPTITSLKGLPPGLKSLRAAGANINSLAGLPPGLKSLQASGGNINSLEGLPPGLQSLKIISGANISSLAGLPPGLWTLAVSRVNINNLAGLPPGLKSLQVSGGNINSLEGLPPALEKLSVWLTGPIRNLILPRTVRVLRLSPA